jgi:hypothetical protein
MPEYIVNLWLDGYDTEEQMEEACDEFIYDQLNFTASSVRVKRSDYAALLARHDALVEAVAWERECIRQLDCAGKFWEDDNIPGRELIKILDAARAEVDRLIANEGADDCKGEG